MGAPAPSPGFVAADEATALIDKCPVVGTIESYFRIPPGQDYRDVFPNMGKSPELDEVDDAFVVVYSGEVQVMALGGRPDLPRPKLVDVLCVVLPSGEPIVYSDISRQGMQLPAGAHQGAPD